MRNVGLHQSRYLVLCLLLSAFACNPPAMATSTAPSLPPPSSTPAASASARPAITSAPRFEAAPCAFPVPRGYEPECGYLIVPENRARPDSQSIRLHVAVFRNRAGIPNPDPVIKISGGPGSSGLNTTGFLLSGALDTVLESRDFVVFDQRGTGYSRPRLDCPERVAITPALLGGRLSADESAQAILDAFRRCRERFMAEGIDLSAYHSAASAADIDDLRTVLGYEQWNIYAISYGTRLALTLMRDHPGTVEMGYGSTEALAFVRPVLVFRSNAYLLDQPAVREHRLAGVHIPAATFDALRGCRVRYWLIPKGEEPFSGRNAYDAVLLRPLFPDEFRRAFAETYQLTSTTNYYDAWECKPGSTP